jgi:hypothetical protein
MKYLAFSIVFALQYKVEVYSQNVCGARMAALSGSALTQADAFAGFHNFSANASKNSNSFAIYGQNPYGMTDIKDAGAAISMHFGTGVMGVVCQSYGNVEFNRKRMNFGYALPLSEKFSASASLGFSSTRISNGYGRSSTFWTNVGATYTVRKDWKWAAVADLPMRSLKNEEDLSASLRLGTTYSFGEQVHLSAQLNSTSSHISSLTYSFGVEYFPVEIFAVRLGMNTFWQTWSLGFGTHLKNYSFDASAVLHPQLGITPQISFVYGMEK